MREDRQSDDLHFGSKISEPSSVLLYDWLTGVRKEDLHVRSASSPALFFKAWMPSMVQVEAAGGVVKNHNNETLFIFRNDFWDLPKGHVDPGEVHLQTALREVEEETGLDKLLVIKPLPDTWHCYFLKGRWHLKHSCWFEMQYKGDKVPQPQLSEGIVRAEWISAEKLPDILSRTYRSVHEVLGHLI